MKVKDIVLKEMGTGKITAVTPDGGVEITGQDGIKTVLPKDKTAALTPDAGNPNKFDLNTQAIAPQGADANAPKGPQVGAEVDMQTAETHTTDASDELIHDITADEGIFGLGNKSPEEWAQTSKQMAQLLQLQKAYQGTPYQEQIEKRIKLLKDRLDMDQGEVAGPGGAPKPVVPPEQFKGQLEEEPTEETVEEPVAVQESTDLADILKIAGLK
jgi:hypothetical protein